MKQVVTLCVICLGSAGARIDDLSESRRRADRLVVEPSFHPFTTKENSYPYVQNPQRIDHHEQLLRQREVNRDLQLAHEVQWAFLPFHRPVIPGYRFFDYYEPVYQVGGDYFDYIPLADGRLAVVVADVVGHGIAAAMLMAKLSAETRFCLAMESDPADAVTELNKRLSELTLDRLVTLVMTVLDPRTHQVTIVCAGHMPPMHRRRDGTVDQPGNDSRGLPLAVAERVRYGHTTIKRLIARGGVTVDVFGVRIRVLIT